MSFTLDASKTQATTSATDAATTGGLPNFSFGTGAGDAAKPTGFPLMSSQSKPGGLFSTGLGSTTAPNTGFNFGATAAPTLGAAPGNVATSAQTPGLTFGATTTPSAGLPFGGSTSSGAFGTPAATGFTVGAITATTTTPTTGLTFGTTSLGGGGTIPAVASTVSFGAPSSLIGTGFGLGSATTATTSAATTTTGGFTLGTSAITTTAPGLSLDSSKTSTAPTSTGFSLGAPSTTSGASGFSFGLGTTTATTAGFGLNKTATSTVPSSLAAPATHTTLGTTTTVSSSASSGQLGAINFCQLEESINKWTLELEEQEKVFVNQATQVNAWDKLLITNGEKIVTLNQEVERVKIEQQQLEHELDYVVGQQKELQDCLVPLEKELASLSVSDPEREYTYRLSENLDTQLKQMSEDLKEIIEHLNEANRTQDSSDPIVQIGKILNAHMNSLQWLDQQTALLSQKIQQIDQMHQNFRQENERTFNLAYN